MTDTSAQRADWTGAAAPGTIRVWDPLVRFFHWGLVLAFATAWLSADEVQPLHEVAGYTVAGLIGFRLVWGSRAADTRDSRSSSADRPRRSPMCATCSADASAAIWATTRPGR